MTTIFKSFCDDKTSFINPTDVTERIPDFPEVCITTFSENIIDTFIENNPVEIIANLYSANGVLPVYEITYAGRRIALFLSRVGAPACAVGLEEVIALGARRIIQFGSCGILDESAVRGKIIIPSSAVRDEGTSYHYMKGTDEIYARADSVNMVRETLENLKIPYVLGKTWTTDGIYRETVTAIEQRKSQGCVAVEMECSASLAVAQFRNIPLLQFLFGADNLDSEKWEPRDLGEHGVNCSDKYMQIALECAVTPHTLL